MSGAGLPLTSAQGDISRVGVHSFLIRGFDPYEDTIDFGHELIPRLREGAAELDRAKAA